MPEPMCLPTMTQVGREHTTQCVSMDHLRETILRRTIYEGNMDKVDHLRETILRHTICEGNMDKVEHLRGKQF